MEHGPPKAMTWRIDIDAFELAHPRFVLEQGGHASSELTTHTAHQDPHTRHMPHAIPWTATPNGPDQHESGWSRLAVGVLAAATAVVAITAGSPAGAVEEEEPPTTEPAIEIAEAATVGATAQRVVPDPSEGLLPFPVSPFPRCVVANNYRGDSKANGPGGHEGVDIGADEGTPVYAVEDGVLTRRLTDLSSAAGLGWILLGVSDTEYRYYHLFDFAEGLDVGDEVERGQLIGSVGSTGNAHPTGWHLHFEVRPGPQPDRGSADTVDPVPLLHIPDTCTIY